jgi:hypothetical protein
MYWYMIVKTLCKKKGPDLRSRLYIVLMAQLHPFLISYYHHPPLTMAFLALSFHISKHPKVTTLGCGLDLVLPPLSSPPAPVDTEDYSVFDLQDILHTC